MIEHALWHVDRKTSLVPAAREVAYWADVRAGISVVSNLLRAAEVLGSQQDEQFLEAADVPVERWSNGVPSGAHSRLARLGAVDRSSSSAVERHGVRYEWVLEGDIKACFDEIDHTALMDRVRHRIGDKRVLGLVKAFLKAGVLSEGDIFRDTDTGTPQGGILSPLLANIALSVLDDHFVEAWQHEMATPIERKRRRSRGLPNYRLVRYADDFVVVIHGTDADAEQLRDEVAAVLAPMGLRLSETKTTIAHIDEGFDFLGWRIQRHRKRGTAKQFVYTYPSKTSLAKVMATVKTLCRQGRNEPLSELLRRLNPVLRGWTNYFRHGVSAATFGFLRAYTWARVVNWLRRKHPHANWKWLRRRYLPRWWPTEDEATLFDPAAVRISYARYRGQIIDVTPWATGTIV